MKELQEKGNFKGRKKSEPEIKRTVQKGRECLRVHSQRSKALLEGLNRDRMHLHRHLKHSVTREDNNPRKRLAGHKSSFEMLVQPTGFLPLIAVGGEQ